MTPKGKPSKFSNKNGKIDLWAKIATLGGPNKCLDINKYRISYNCAENKI